MKEAVGLVNCKSFAIETSPAPVKLTGNEEVTEVSDTAKILEPESRILNKLPEVEPFAPIFSANKSPVAVVADPGDQSKFINDPVPALPVIAVEVVRISARVPDVKVFPVVAIWANLPVVIESDVRYSPVPELIAVASITKAEVVVVPVVAWEVKVCEPVPELNAKAVAPVAFPKVIVLASVS